MLYELQSGIEAEARSDTRRNVYRDGEKAIVGRRSVEKNESYPIPDLAYLTFKVSSVKMHWELPCWRKPKRT